MDANGWRAALVRFLVGLGLTSAQAEEIVSYLHQLLQQWQSESKGERAGDDLGELLEESLRSLKSGRFDKCGDDLLSEEVFRPFQDQAVIRCDGLQAGDKRVTPSDLAGSPAGQYLADYRVIHSNGSICLGAHTMRWGQLFPSTFLEAFSNQLARFWPEAYRSRYVAGGAASAWPEAESLVEIDFSKESEQLMSWCRDVLDPVHAETTDRFVKMPDPVDFYSRIQPLYVSRDADFAIHVFSTTSGLAMKEQFLGSDELKLNQFRRTYFEVLRRCKGKIYYQLDPATTWGSPKGIAHSAFPLEDHIEHLARFLEMPNLELSEANFREPETQWRRYYTLVNSDCQVAYSSRDRAAKAICNGVVAHHRYWADTDQNPYEVVHDLYASQEKRVLKPITERPWSRREALKEARQILGRWQREYSHA